MNRAAAYRGIYRQNQLSDGHCPVPVGVKCVAGCDRFHAEGNVHADQQLVDRHAVGSVAVTNTAGTGCAVRGADEQQAADDTRVRNASALASPNTDAAWRGQGAARENEGVEHVPSLCSAA